MGAFLARVQRLTDPRRERSEATRWAASQLELRGNCSTLLPLNVRILFVLTPTI